MFPPLPSNILLSTSRQDWGKEELFASAMDSVDDYLSETDFFGTMLMNTALELSPGGTSLIEREDLNDFFYSVEQDFENLECLDPPPKVITSTDRVLTEYVPEYNESEPLPSPSSSIESSCTSTTRLTRRGNLRKPKMYESDLPTDDPRQEKRIINAMKAKKNRDDKKRKELEMEKKCERLERINKHSVMLLKGMDEKLKKLTNDKNSLLNRNRKKERELRKLRGVLSNFRTKMETVVSLSEPDSRVRQTLSEMLTDLPGSPPMDQEEEEFQFKLELEEDLKKLQPQRLCQL